MNYTKGKWNVIESEYTDLVWVKCDDVDICCALKNKANAERIVQCVNSHDELLKTCKSSLRLMEFDMDQNDLILTVAERERAVQKLGSKFIETFGRY